MIRVLSPPQSQSHVVVCVSTPRMYLQSGYFLVHALLRLIIFVESEILLNIFFQTLRTHAKMQHNVILPTESKKGKKLGPRKNKTIRTAKPQEVPSIMRPNVVLPNVAPLNLASIHNSQDSQSVASEDSWAPQVSC